MCVELLEVSWLHHTPFNRSSIDMMQFFSDMPMFFTEADVVLAQT
jgi:hypothetical protein